MPHQITHPTKEQVRAYMARREAAQRPPPTPEEIRRQLGWRMVSQGREDYLPVSWYLFPSSFPHLIAQIALDWCIASVRSASRHSGKG